MLLLFLDERDFVLIDVLLVRAPAHRDLDDLVEPKKVEAPAVFGLV